MTSTLRSRQGFALPVAIGAIVLIGTMLAGIFFLVTQETRIGKNTASQEIAFRAAERGTNMLRAMWAPSMFSGLTTGTPVREAAYTYDSTGLGGPADTVVLTKVASNMFMVVSTGRAGASAIAASFGARKRTSMIIKLLQPQFNFIGALTVRGALQVGGSSNINGNDTAPNGWSCPSLTNALAGIATNNGSNITYSGCNNLSCIQGSPKIDTTAAAADSNTYFKFGDATWNSLVAMANITIAGGQTLTSVNPVVTNGVCDKTQPLNWGDANRATPTAGACEGYFPIIHITDTTANTNINGVAGQGILLVEGDLTVNGGFSFYGPVIIRGHLRTQGTGGHFYGGVMAGNVDLEQNAVLGNAIINYSNCAVQYAILGASGGAPVAQRAWSEIF